jgi:hypothetical protein
MGRRVGHGAGLKAAPRGVKAAREWGEPKSVLGRRKRDGRETAMTAFMVIGMALVGLFLAALMSGENTPTD